VSPLARWSGRVGLAAGLASVVVALTWLLERWAMPAPYSGFLAIVLVGLTATEVLRRRPRQRAVRLFHVYLRARERGADEPSARAGLLAQFDRDPAGRATLAREIEARWSGPSEKERVVGGVAALLARERRAFPPALLAATYDAVRDRFTISGWEALPREFVTTLRAVLDPQGLSQLDALVDKYALLQQRFFRQPSALGTDPAAGVVDFARLLSSLGNTVRKDHPGDAERAYRLSLRLRPEENLAHAGLALLLEETGRLGAAAEEARLALAVLDGYAARAAERPPTREDISPFRSPLALREALQRVAEGG
jgi:hypothetical protein